MTNTEIAVVVGAGVVLVGGLFFLTKIPAPAAVRTYYAPQAQGAAAVAASNGSPDLIAQTLVQLGGRAIDDAFSYFSTSATGGDPDMAAQANDASADAFVV